MACVVTVVHSFLMLTVGHLSAQRANLGDHRAVNSVQFESKQELIYTINLQPNLMLNYISNEEMCT